MAENVDKAEAKEEAPKVDPYADVPDDIRDTVKAYDKELMDMPPVERARLINKAKAALNEAETLRKEVEKLKAAPKREAEAEDSDDPVLAAKKVTSELREELKQLRGDIDAQRQEAKQAQQIAEFQAELKRAFSDDAELQGDEEFLEELQAMAIGHMSKTKPGSIRDGVKKFVETYKKIKSKDRTNYATRKASSARDTRGESRGGATPSEKAWKPGHNSIVSGEILQRIKQRSRETA